MENSLGLVTNLSLTAWYTHVSRADKLLNELTDDQLLNEVSPERNSGVYLLGHLAAVHDAMLPLLGLGERLHPEMENIFIKNPDKSGLGKPPLSDLRNYWHEVNDELSKHFAILTPEEWLQKHTSVNEEDFKKDQNRNRLNVLISRTNHLAFHLGQLIFLKK